MTKRSKFAFDLGVVASQLGFRRVVVGGSKNWVGLAIARDQSVERP